MPLLSRLSSLLGLLLLLTGLSVLAPAPGTAHDVDPVAARPTAGPAPRASSDPRLSRGLFVDPYMPAAQAGKTYSRIGKVAQALWITDYYATPGTAKKAVADYTRRAVAAKKTPIMTVYAIPGRDCGLASSGGLPSSGAYQRWVAAVAAGMKGRHAIVVLEPDAVAFMEDPRRPECQDPAPRQRLLTYAAKALHDAGAWVYIDAGHSNWQSPTVMAQRLVKSGIRYARGFTTNIGNFRPTADEVAYAKSLNYQLARRKATGKRYLVETARNGVKPSADGFDVCNPLWARLGAVPRLQFKGAYDGNVWIKHPGESDGDRNDDQQNCHGGPPSGQWWPQGARRLMAS